MLLTLEEQYPDLPLLPQIPLSVRSAESAAERTSVLEYMPRSPVAAAYRSVAIWIDEPEPTDPPVPPALIASEELHV
jgi:chromosome partitioning protein